MSQDLSAQPLRVAFETLGCRSNFADTTELQAALVERGAVPCAFDDAPDVYVINTCTVTDDADKTALKLIRKARAAAPNARVVVTGCMAEVDAPRIAALEAADSIVGPGRKADVVAAIFGATSSKPEASPERQPLRRKRAQFFADAIAEPLSQEIVGPGETLGEVKTRARFHLRVQEGCENSCTFCIIPFSRGGLVSRPKAEILRDLEQLHAAGYQEVVLTGTHLGGYGEDCGSSLTELLRELAVSSPVPRLRLSSLDPNDVSPELVDTLAASNVFCNHLHICVQAFTDSVLKRMNRRYRMGDVIEIVRYIEHRMPGCRIGTDLIAGFPGEDRQNVEQATALFLDLPFSYLHVFPYSERSGTAATLMDGVVAREERKRRVARWRAISDARWLEYSRTLHGRPVEAVLEGLSFDEDGQPTAHGTTREFATAVFKLSGDEAEECRAHNALPPGIFGSLRSGTVSAIEQLGGRVRCE